MKVHAAEQTKITQEDLFLNGITFKDRVSLEKDVGNFAKGHTNVRRLTRTIMFVMC
jgi:hypothetical protein